MQEAMFYEKLDHGQVQCNLCTHFCIIKENALGVCHVRQNIDGNLYALNHGRLVSQHIDPIEKKPLYHFYPGSSSYSIAAPGCNYSCRWCQNWQISQQPDLWSANMPAYIAPEQVVAIAKKNDCKTIAYTYTEPTIFYEYAYQTAKLAHTKEIANIFVTNGNMSTEALKEISPWLDAANVDLKAFKQRTYSQLIGGNLKSVLDNLKLMKKLGIWVEVTTLVIPGVNDSSDEINEIANFIALELGHDTPWHLSRFFPHNKMPNTPPTPPQTLQNARAIGFAAGLKYVYLGNVRGSSNTICPACDEVLIQREDYFIGDVNINEGKCKKCGESIAGIWV